MPWLSSGLNMPISVSPGRVETKPLLHAVSTSPRDGAALKDYIALGS